ncbi:hypothetical protein MN0502_11730 [Arthrobacter sp. MN05-02]|nr:hypothetical protein MN0502_11730 [Arthrobacter sp. MN05-02]
MTQDGDQRGQGTPGGEAAGPASGTVFPGPARAGGDDLVQLIDAAGVRHPHGHYDDLVADVDGAALQKLYEDMVVVRRIDAEATALQRQGELALWPPAARSGSGPDRFRPCPALRRLRLLQLPRERRRLLPRR